MDWRNRLRKWINRANEIGEVELPNWVAKVLGWLLVVVAALFTWQDLGNMLKQFKHPTPLGIFWVVLDAWFIYRVWKRLDGWGWGGGGGWEPEPEPDPTPQQPASL